MTNHVYKGCDKGGREGELYRGPPIVVTGKTLSRGPHFIAPQKGSRIFYMVSSLPLFDSYKAPPSVGKLESASADIPYGKGGPWNLVLPLFSILKHEAGCSWKLARFKVRSSSPKCSSWIEVLTLPDTKAKEATGVCAPIGKLFPHLSMQLHLSGQLLKLAIHWLQAEQASCVSPVESIF